MSTLRPVALLALAHMVNELREGLDVSILRLSDRQPHATKRASFQRCHQPQQLGAVVETRSIPHSGTRPYRKAAELSSRCSPGSPGPMLHSFCWPRRQVKLLFDQNLSHRLVNALQDIYLESLHVRDIA